MTMPFGTYRNAIRVGAEAVAANAGVMASRTGSAMAAPIPCNIARREIRLLRFIRSSLHSVPHLKRRALDDSENHAREPVISGGGAPADFIDCGAVRTFQTPPQSKRQHFL